MLNAKNEYRKAKRYYLSLVRNADLPYDVAARLFFSQCGGFMSLRRMEEQSRIQNNNTLPVDGRTLPFESSKKTSTPAADTREGWRSCIRFFSGRRGELVRKGH